MSPPLRPALLLRIFVPFALGYFLSYLFRVVNAVIAPELSAELGLGASDLGLLTSAYFLAFAAFQLPLGILLDRYGPRRTEAVLLLFAAAGALIFARAEETAGLIAGRALIGFGVSACLMAAFKAFVQWFPAERLAAVNGLQLAAGGVGALAATTPVEMALGITDWRGIFSALALLTLLAALLIFLLAPERESKHHGLNLGDHIQGIVSIFASRRFWRLTPWTVTSQAAFLAIQGLWTGPWLRDVAGLERAQGALYQAWIAAAMVAGFALIGLGASRLIRRGIATEKVAATGMLLFMLAQLAIIGGWGGVPAWALFGFTGTSGVLAYAALSQHFPAHLAGRANTALNLLVFVGAFGAQWCIGALIGLWPEDARGHYPAAGYHWAFTAVLLSQAIGMAWYYLQRERP
ncbi:MAG: hypothetical protein B0D96_04500 [Candidatus Sedimenticola endophacoides]|uniref:MFS transporter n=1 Tax=Candidatus Sedimenticola endophacoides TaxID=2548426 RepID=A0A6N4E1B2_9GAMM|nr:MAG: hypothetical protein B0D94_08565 [Candidatus Sedimenticola endophacoides]OQX36334.1 MAG: hypothetical protein B0D96_04500 [Candidatus Sedimenticola endophacoides]OQX40848.1 MAG: hypothetical protein B0D89_06280 [Candidatus Sedimenticola endophacoides]PUD99328.1 MAG: MFS transporter [Candidatus Sedimenticola endophacoides]PUE02958.1 MAG: MFS transporter [Candidatus Sedimenticola endophacoides]